MMGRASARQANAAPPQQSESTISLPVKNNEILSDMLSTLQTFKDEVDAIRAAAAARAHANTTT